MIDGKFKKFIIETILLLKMRALEAKKDEANPKDGLKEYAQGFLMGYYSIISLLKHQAFVFCIDQKELGLSDIEPDMDLLGLHRNSNTEYEDDNWAIDILDENKIKRYLCDTITLLKKEALEVKKEGEKPKEGSKEYSKGELMAYCSAITIFIKQADIFKIDHSQLGLAAIDAMLFLSLKG